MKLSARVHGFAGLFAEGILTAEGIVRWEEGQSGPVDVKRRQVYNQPHPGFGKLQPTDKIAFGAASLACRQAGEFDGGSTGICLGSAFGSFSTDMRYMESVLSGFPRPALFSATLPSSPVAETAILYGLKGPNRVFVDSRDPGLTALESGLRILKHGDTKNMLVIMVRALYENDTSFAGHVTLPQPATACALFLSSGENSPDCAPSICLEGEYRNGEGAGSYEEWYFLDILKSLMRNRNTTIAIATSQFDGAVTVQGDKNGKAD